MPDVLLILDGLVVNFALLITFSFVTSLLAPVRADTPRHAARNAAWLLLHAVSPLVLLGHAVVFKPGLLFDLRNVPIALATIWGGPLAGVLVSVPVAAYRAFLGGPGALPTLLGLALIIAASTFVRPRLTLRRFELRAGGRAAGFVFGVGCLPIFLAFHLAGQSVLAAAAIYAAIASLGTVGLLCGLAVLSARLSLVDRNRTLSHLAHVDALTGARNRRAFEADFADVRRPACLLLLDLDHFKGVNDSHGHDVGDRVLAETARVVTDVVRPRDRVYRLGGEEFVVILEECGVDVAPRVADRVRDAVARDVARRCGLARCVTVSGGLTALRDTAQETLHVADALLYRAKAAGRNRVLHEQAAPALPTIVG